MNGWPFTVAYIVGLLVLTGVSAAAFRCNLRRLLHAWRTAPLDGMDLSGAAVVPVPVGHTWPPVEDVDDPAVAAGYASLAQSRAVNWTVAGELLTVVGGAALGLSLPLALAGGFNAWPCAIALGVAAIGAFMRLTAVRLWDQVAARYRTRYRELTAVPPPPPAPPRRPWRQLLGAFGVGPADRPPGT